MKTKDLVAIAMYAALFAVLEYFGSAYNFLRLPQGGSISLSSIPLLLASYHLGFKKSLIVIAISMVVKFMIKSPTVVHWFQFLADYIFAYGSYSIACLVPDFKVRKHTLPTGVLAANLLRYIFHNIAGVVFFAQYYKGDVLRGVSLYNATYMIPTAIIGFVIVAIVKPRLRTINN